MLDISVKQRILERYQQMYVEGRLLSRLQLDQFYATFRDRFGPDRLANLDGEALLETMHAHGNKDTPHRRHLSGRHFDALELTSPDSPRVGTDCGTFVKNEARLLVKWARRA